MTSRRAASLPADAGERTAGWPRVTSRGCCFTPGRVRAPDAPARSVRFHFRFEHTLSVRARALPLAGTYLWSLPSTSQAWAGRRAAAALHHYRSLTYLEWRQPQCRCSAPLPATSAGYSFGRGLQRGASVGLLS